VDFIKSKRELCHPITFPMSAPTADGGAAAVVCSEEFLKRHNLQVHMYCIYTEFFENSKAYT